MSPNTRLASFAFILAFASLAGCAKSIEDAGTPDSVVDLQDTSSDTPPQAGASDPDNDAPAVPSTATPVYFNEPNYLEGSPNADASYSFDLLADARISIHLARATDAGPKSIGFSLYRVTADGKALVVGHVADTDGSAEAELWSEHGGRYVIEIDGGESPASLVLDLACLSVQCTQLRQPGQTCGSSEPYLCAEGLVCRFADGMCKAGDTPAKCQIPPSSCSNVRAPVCGCDGQTWGNECFARLAGVSVLKNDECASDK